jgi:DNA invertase Pin-like site-specific DNA recombinase
LKVAIYARYSSDNQRDASIADQLRVCREFASRQGWTVIQEFTDHAISGATLLRPGFQALMRDALNQRFDIVLAEALDRFSRDQEDTAGLFKRLTFAGVSIVTLAEGDITHLHVGLKGTMNALFLKDLAEKTRRGLRGRVELGKSGGGLCFGYRVRPATHRGAGTGDREIVPAEAEVVRRIFRDYSAGLSPKAIAKRLNAECCPGPGRAPWNPSTIHGNPARGTGILNNELYVGRLVWNRLRYVKDPDTGKRVSRPNAPSEWVTTAVPGLRVLDDELWNQVKARQVEMRRVASNGEPKRFNQARRPKYLFSGLTKCAECGGGYVMYWRDRLACFGARSRGTCTNRLTISRQEVEERVLVALREKLMRRDLFEDFCEEYVRELNRLRMEHRAGLSSARSELASVERGIRKLVQAIKDGVSALSIKDELLSLEARNAELQSRLNAPEMPELLHPRMADVYSDKVRSLCHALESEDSRTGAVDAIRALIETILLAPDGDGAEDHVEGRPGRNAERGQRQQEVARYRRPPGPNKAGCGGPQQIVPAALLGGSVNVNTLAFLTEVLGARRLSLG